RLSPDGRQIALLDETGQMTIHSTTDGATSARFTVPERGKVLRFSPDSKQLLLGTFRGSVLAYGLDGKLLWQTRLVEFNDVLGRELPLYDPSFPDHTAKLWPVSRDEPGELDKLRSEEHTSELQSLAYLVCRLLLEKKNKITS